MISSDWFWTMINYDWFWTMISYDWFWTRPGNVVKCPLVENVECYNVLKIACLVMKLRHNGLLKSFLFILNLQPILNSESSNLHYSSSNTLYVTSTPLPRNSGISDKMSASAACSFFQVCILNYDQLCLVLKFDQLCLVLNYVLYKTFYEDIFIILQTNL